MHRDVWDHTQQVEVLDELKLGAGLVRGTEDVDEQTTGQGTGEDAISVDVGLVQAASDLAARALGLGLVNAERAIGVRLSDSTGDEESRGEGQDVGELHFD